VVQRILTSELLQSKESVQCACPFDSKKSN